MNKKSALIPATLGSLLMASKADGAIVHVVTPISAVGNVTVKTDWDIDGNAVNDALWSRVGPNALYIFNAAPVGFGIIEASNIKNLATGYVISAGRAFGTFASIITAGAFKGASGFTTGNAGYVGFRFAIAGATHYGWARLTFDTSSTGGVTIHEWAYENVANTNIQIAAVPEPAHFATGLGLLALGAAGLRRWRGRRGASATTC